MTLPEIEIKESLKKRKGNIINIPQRKRRTIRVRKINKSYQANNEEEEKGEGRMQRDARERRGGYRR